MKSSHLVDNALSKSQIPPKKNTNIRYEKTFKLVTRFVQQIPKTLQNTAIALGCPSPPPETDGKLLLQKILCPGNAEIRSPWDGNNLNTSLVKIIFPGMRRFHKNFKMREK